MTETNIVMDEEGEMFVPWNDGSNEEEMSVDGPPQQSEQSIENDVGDKTGLQSSSENKAVNMVADALQRLKNTNNGQGESCSQEKTQESLCNCVTGPESSDTTNEIQLIKNATSATNEIQLTEDNDGHSLSIVNPSESPFMEDTRKLCTESNADSVDAVKAHSDSTAEVDSQHDESTTPPFENNQSQGQPVSITSTSKGKEELSSNLLVQPKQSEAGDDHHWCPEDAVVAAEPVGPAVCSEVVCSTVRDENGSMDSDSEEKLPKSKPSEDLTGIEPKDKISVVTEEALPSPTKSSPKEMKPSKEEAFPSHLEEGQTQTVPNVPLSSPQRKSSVILKSTSDVNIQTESQSDPSTDKDQLYPLRKMQEERDLERFSHTQAMDLSISDTQQYKIQEIAKEHTTERSIQKSEKEGLTPSSKKDETKAETTTQHQVLQTESSTMKKQQEIQRGVPFEEMKGGAVQLCSEERNVKETVQPNQVNAVHVTPEDIDTPLSNTGIKTQLSVPREQVLTESQIEKAIDLTKTENIAHQQMLQVGSVMETRPSIKHNNNPSESMQMTTTAAQLYPEVISQSQSPEKKTDVPREEALLGPQIEKTGDNGLEATAKLNAEAKSREPIKNGNAEFLTETQPHPGMNNSALEVIHHREEDAHGLVTRTVNHPQEMLPEVVPEAQNTQPMLQPFYSEPSDSEDHLYVEPEEIQLIEDPYVREQVRRLEHVTLNIAVTGMTGAGKSTFINAIRGIHNDSEKAAPTGVTETTIDVCAYPHPTMPNVNLWDLPGTGSPKFKAKRYLKEVKFESYDFFIIISSERFKENDMMLAKEIREKNKKFYFLRSKIDNEIRAEQCRKTFDEQKLLHCVRQDCINHLKKIVQPTVFLICSFELDKYDFPELVDALSRDLPEHKKDALTLSLPIYSTEVLEKKIQTLTKTAQSAAKAAAAISVAPVPGLAMACDAGILLAFFSKCYYAFGLDDKSLDKLSERVNNWSLKALRESRPLVMAVRRRELSGRELSELGSKRAALEFAYSLVPVWGSKRAANMSRSATLNLLNEGLKELADTARDVLKTAKIDHIY